MVPGVGWETIGVFCLFACLFLCHWEEAESPDCPSSSRWPGGKVNYDLGTYTELFYLHMLWENLEGPTLKTQHSFIPAGKGHSRMGEWSHKPLMVYNSKYVSLGPIACDFSSPDGSWGEAPSGMCCLVTEGRRSAWKCGVCSNFCSHVTLVSCPHILLSKASHTAKASMDGEGKFLLQQEVPACRIVKDGCTILW